MPVLFTGQSEHTIDSKLRLAIPAKYRSLLDQERDGVAWYCVPWPGGVLRLYTETKFSQLAEQQDQTLTPGEDEADLEVELFGDAERLEMDKEGRIAIPKNHLELTGLKSEIVIIGARNRLEVRDRATWTAGQKDRFARIPTLVARIESKRRERKE